MKAIITALVFAVSLLTASAAMSTMSITEYNENKENKQKWSVTGIYLNGVGVGATLAAAVLLQKRMPSLFCQPEEIVLNRKSYTKLIDAFIAKNDIPEETPVETVLIMALITAFPCK
ncbi:MAG: hypothetical protein KDI33_03960 [Halioglobus sp.]|nr:hypothetical protein [Halioglobus sp.]